MAPYVVLLKPRHGLRILENQPQAGVSPAAVYIFRQQLAEADIVAINRIDELPEVEIARLTSLLEQHYPGRRLLPISAKTGQGFAALEQMISRPGDSATDPPAIDYAQYAAGEAALGWLNGSLFIAGPAPFSLAALVLDLVRQMQTGLIAAGGQIAHVKAVGSAHGATAAANVVGNDFSPDFSLASAQSTTQAEVTVNARVGIDPENLQRCVLTAIDEVCAARRLQSRIVQMQSFRPNGPAPPYCVVP